jgi:hypothetical protein
VILTSQQYVIFLADRVMHRFAGEHTARQTLKLPIKEQLPTEEGLANSSVRAQQTSIPSYCILHYRSNPHRSNPRASRNERFRLMAGSCA